MIEALLAVDGGRFRFDPALLTDLATRIWPEAIGVRAQGQVADVLDSYLHLPGPQVPGQQRGCVLGLHRAGEAIGISSGSARMAADVIAWICAVSQVPGPDDEGRVVLLD